MNKKSDIKELCAYGLAVVEIEAQAVRELSNRINDNFAKACQHILACTGKIIVTGMGKSGHIANKIAATLASTGSPSFYVHPAEACHGDMGMFSRNDCVIALSNSGKTDEVLTMLPLIKRLGVPLITLTGDSRSPLAQAADVNIDLSIDAEACPLGLAPTTSTTVALVMGDAIAVTLLKARGFTSEEFAHFHPAGALGKRLLLRVEDLMHQGNSIPKIHLSATLRDALVEMTAKGFGMTTVVDDNDQLLGVYTDGDVRRTLDKGLDIHTVTMVDVVNRGCKTISSESLAAKALQLMEQNKITSLVVADKDNHVNGLIHMHDLLRAGVA